MSSVRWNLPGNPQRTTMKKKTTHGGVRSNAGRRKGDKPALHAITLRFQPDTLKRLTTLKTTLGLSWPSHDGTPQPRQHEQTKGWRA